MVILGALLGHDNAQLTSSRRRPSVGKRSLRCARMDLLKDLDRILASLFSMAPNIKNLLSTSCSKGRLCEAVVLLLGD